MLRLTLTQMRAAAPRLVAAGLAILLGTAFVTATLLASSVMERTTYNAVTAQYADADLVITDGITTSATLAQIRDLDGVAAADSMAQTGAELSNGSRSEFTVTGGLASDPSLQRVDFAAGSSPQDDHDVAISQGTAQRLGLSIGDEVTLSAQHWSPQTDQPETKDFQLRVTGLLTDQAMQLFMPTGAVVTPQLLQQIRSFSAPDSADQLSELIIAVADGAQVQQVQRQVEQVLADTDATGAQVRTTTEVAEAATAQITGNQMAMLALLLAFAAVSLIVAALVIANTFQVLIAQRTRTLALLRCVGALKRQVRSSVLIEAAFLGVLASLAGVAVGIGLVAAGLAFLAHYQPDIPVATDLVLTPAAVLVPVLTGLVVTVAAALLPARLATRVAPLAALRPAEPRASRASKVRLVFAALAFFVGVVLLLAGWALALNSGQDGTGMILGLGVGILGGLASLLGILLGCVLIVPGLIRLVGRLAGRSVPGRVAVANSTRNPRRSAATASALVIGVALVTMMSTGAVTANRALGQQLDTSFPVDLSVAAPAPLQQEQIDAVTDTDGVQSRALLATTEVSQTSSGDQQPAIHVAAAARGDLTDVVRSEEALAGLSAESIVIPANLALSLGLQDGQDLSLTGASGRPVDLTVQFSSLDGQTAIVTPEVLAQFDQEAPVTLMWARIAGGDVYNTMQNVQAQLTEVSEASPDAPTPQLTGAAVERSSYQNVVNTALTVVLALLAISVIIALIGVANTLSLSVIERRRESAMLRALGLTRGQLRGMLAIEGVMIAAAGALIGIVAGLAYGWFGSAILLGNMVDVPLVVPWQDIGMVAIVAVAAGLLASVLPARSAARTPPAAALAVD